MKTIPLRLSILCVAALLLVGAAMLVQPAIGQEQSTVESKDHDEQQDEGNGLKVEYLEIVTPALNETCDSLATAHGVAFSEPVAELGNARTAELEDGGRIGVRAPMHDGEKPVVRPYVLVDDIEAAVEAAKAAGAEMMMPPMKIPGQGTFAIYSLGGIEHGLWQN